MADSSEMGKVKLHLNQYLPNCPAIRVDVQNGKVMFVTEATKIVRVDSNTVEAYYDGWKETITAEGSGDERHNFKRIIEEVK